MATYQHALSVLAQPEHQTLLSQLNRGLEKEGLRCTSLGVISQKEHPRGLGSALTHPYITTDYSESLLEFITPVFPSAREALAHLDIAHRYAYQQLNGELIWPASMPCILEGEMSVPMANYGSSNSGKLKHVYRHGLWHRYGRMMQCIAGIHYNFSLPAGMWTMLKKLDNSAATMTEQEFISARYFSLIRNFRRYSWLLMYLFGSSPAVCKSFLAGRQHNLDTLHQETLYAPYATSLRMSDFGYQNNAQSELMICHNNVENYVATLNKALHVPVDAYEKIGVKDEQGNYKQLNSNLLQIENEYYSDIRPKRVAKNGERPLQALAKYGVEYIEVRCTDVNPFMPLGIDVPQMMFMDTFLTWCLLQESPDITTEEYLRIKRNNKKTVMEGRRPGLTLERGNEEITLQQWGLNLLGDMTSLAELMDQTIGQTFHKDALTQQRLKLADSRLTPSAQLLRQLQETGLEYSQLVLNLAEKHRKTLSEPLGRDVLKRWQQMARDSSAQQAEMEASDTLSFDEYLAQFLAQSNA